MTCPFCGCDPEEEGFEQGACTCQCGHYKLRPTSLRQHVSDMMVYRHHILPDLADDHVWQMDEAEVERKFLELYVALSEYDDRSEQERAAWAKEQIRKAREVPPGEQAPLPLAPEKQDGREKIEIASR